jgi:uncharacterized protein (UPF0303 family)
LELLDYAHETVITGPRKDAVAGTYEMSDSSIYAVHGRGFLVKVKGVEEVVGVNVVSGLSEEDDQLLLRIVLNNTLRVILEEPP